MPLKILIADDHALLREGLRLLIHSQDDMNVVGEAEDGIDTLEKVRSEQPDVLLLDIAMPRMTGLETIQMVHRIAPETGIVILSRYEKEAYVRKALKAGALGYIVKGEAGATMLEAIRCVAQGRFFLSSQIHKSVISSYLEAVDETEEEHAEFGQLSEREKQIFHLLVQGHSSIEIGKILFISSKTVDKHRASIGKKIGIDNPVKMVQYAIRNGIIDPSVWED